MKFFAEIDKDKIRKIYEQETKPVFAPYIELIDVTNIEPQPKERWLYNRETGLFYEDKEEPPEPVEPQPTLEELQTQTLLNTEYLVTMSEFSNLKGE
ncbi:hypothetical protein ABE042_22060 [Viridibacillus arvi]|uniref:hypothetical protein n=1 Tax=Viridibacillus arvi TaxID=263475 RepID=UPI003D28C4C9